MALPGPSADCGASPLGAVLQGTSAVERWLPHLRVQRLGRRPGSWSVGGSLWKSTVLSPPPSPGRTSSVQWRIETLLSPRGHCVVLPKRGGGCWGSQCGRVPCTGRCQDGTTSEAERRQLRLPVRGVGRGRRRSGRTAPAGKLWRGWRVGGARPAPTASRAPRPCPKERRCPRSPCRCRCRLAGAGRGRGPGRSGWGDGDAPERSELVPCVFSTLFSRNSREQTEHKIQSSCLCSRTLCGAHPAVGGGARGLGHPSGWRDTGTGRRGGGARRCWGAGERRQPGVAFLRLGRAFIGVCRVSAGVAA